MSTILLVVALIIVGVIWFVYASKNQAPTQIKNQNQEIIDRLIEHGSNPEKEHLLELAFYGNKSYFPKLQEYLVSEGYELINGQTDEMLVVGKYHKLHLDEIEEEVEKMEEVARRYTVEFDGWGTSIVP